MREDKHFLEALGKIKRVLLKNNFRGIVYLFGSSVRSDYLRTSDIDMAIDTSDKKAITILRTEFEELDIPYEVDVLDLSEAGEDLRKEILRTGIIIWKS